jgi:hypothetical protein
MTILQMAFILFIFQRALRFPGKPVRDLEPQKAALARELVVEHNQPQRVGRP